MALALLLALLCGAALLSPYPRPDLYPLARKVSHDRWADLLVSGAVLDNSLLLSGPGGDFVRLKDESLVRELRASVGFRSHGPLSARVSLARRGDERVFLQLGTSGPDRSGIFLHQGAGTRLLKDLDAFTRLAQTAASLRLEMVTTEKDLDLRLDGHGARLPLPGTGWHPDLDIRGSRQKGLLMLHDLELRTVSPDGEAGRSIRCSFGVFPVAANLGPALDRVMGRPWASVLSLALLLLAALGLDRALFWFFQRAGRRWQLGLGLPGALALTWPAQVALLLMLRATLRLSYGAAFACLLVTLLARYLELAGEGLVSHQGRPPGRGLAWILHLSGLMLSGLICLALARHPGARTEVDMYLRYLALAPLAALLLSAALGRTLPALVLPLLAVQALVGLALFPDHRGRVLWIIAVLLPLLLVTMVHVVKGKPRGGMLSRVAVVSGALVALLFLLEVGLVATPGISQVVGYREIQRLSDLKYGAHGDPLGLLRGAPKVQVNGKEYRVPKPRGVSRFICLGSSSTQGAGTQDPATESYPARLQELLHARGQVRFQVINAGLDGASLTQLRVFLQEILLHLEPDLVVLYYGSNLDKKSARRHFEELARTVAEAPYLRTREELLAAFMLPYRSPMTVQAFLAVSSTQVFQISRSLVASAVELLHREHDYRAREPRRLLPETARELVRICASRRIPLLLVPEVLRRGVAVPSSTATGNSTLLLRPYADLFGELARDNHGAGVRFATVYSTFTPAMMERYMFDQVHMKPAGYRVLAGAIAAALEEQGLLPTTPPPP